jgi:hypothetical protein
MPAKRYLSRVKRIRDPERRYFDAEALLDEARERVRLELEEIRLVRDDALIEAKLKARDNPATRVAEAQANLVRTEAEAEKAVERAREVRDTEVKAAFAERDQEGLPRYSASDISRFLGVTRQAVGQRWPALAAANKRWGEHADVRRGA